MTGRDDVVLLQNEQDRRETPRRSLVAPSGPAHSAPAAIHAKEGRDRVDPTAMNGEMWRRRFTVLLLGACVLVWRPPFWLPTAIVLLALQFYPLWGFVLRGGHPRRLAWILIACVTVSGVVAAYHRAEANGWSRSVVSAPTRDVVLIAAWAKAHTKTDAVFLVNPGSVDWEAFMGLSERSIVTNWEEGTAINWDPQFTGEWIRRLGLFGFNVRGEIRENRYRLRKTYEDLTDDDIDRLHTSVSFRYWIVMEDRVSGFPEVYRSGDHKVLDTEATLTPED